MNSGSPGNPNLPPVPGSGLSRTHDQGRAASRGAPGLGRRAPVATPPALTGIPSPADLLRGLQRHLALALSLGLIFGTLSALSVWYLYKTTRYSASSLLEVSSSTPQLMRSNVPIEESQLKDYQTTQATYIKSRRVLGRAISRKGAAQAIPPEANQVDPIIWLADNLAVDFNGEIMTIGLQGDNRANLITLVNAVTDAYLEQVVNRENDQKLKRYKELKVAADKYREDLIGQRDTMRQLAKNAGSNDPQTLAFTQQLLASRMSENYSQLSLIQSKIRESKIQLGLLQNNGSDAETTDGAAADETDLNNADGKSPAIDSATVEAAVNQHPAVQEIQGRIAELERSLVNHRRLTRNQTDPVIRRNMQELNTANHELETTRQSVRKEVVNQMAASASRSDPRLLASAIPGGGMSPQAIAEDAAMLERIIQFHQENEKELIAAIDKLGKDAKALNNNTLDLESNQEDVNYIEDYARRLENEVQQLGIELNAPGRVRLIEKAEVAMPLSLKKKAMLTGITGLGTLSMILAGFAWWDARNRRVARADDIVQGLGLNLVGILPALPTRTQRRALARRNAAPAWEHMLMESVDATRTMLLHASRHEKLHVVMVTSAVKGEGKTSLASHLSTSLARARQRTLLIDGDLRSPTLHALFDLPRGPGLAEVLRGECDMVDALQATPAPSLTLITAGHVDADAIASLAEGRLQHILEQAREQFDFIIVDSAPVLPVADSLQICQHVDAVIFSVLRDVSRLPKIHAAYEKLATLNVRMLGAVVAGTKTDRDSYYAAYPYASSTTSV